jgi:hypothetical protein
MFLTIYTIIHVIISLVGILSGFVVLAGLLRAKRFDCATALFLTTTATTSVTGFFFPFHGFTPAIGLGIISLVVLTISAFARYPGHMAGGWRKTYVITAVLALYFNVFVLVVQLFEKVPALKALAPTQTEPPFKITQLVVLILFIVLGTLAAIRFRPEPVPVASK